MARSRPLMIGGSAAEQKRYQADCDVHTLREAEEIRKDAKRHAAARRLAAEKAADLQRVAKPAPRSTRAKK